MPYIDWLFFAEDRSFFLLLRLDFWNYWVRGEDGVDWDWVLPEDDLEVVQFRERRNFVSPEGELKKLRRM